MFDDPLIKKIIRIGGTTFLVLWLGQCLFTGGQTAQQMSDSRKLMLLSGLYNQATLVSNSVHAYVRTHDELPDDFEGWQCSAVSMPCAMREWEGWLYVRDGQYWLALYPYFDDDGELAFDCRVSLQVPGDNYHHSYSECERVAGAALPFVWDEAPGTSLPPG